MKLTIKTSTKNGTAETNNTVELENESSINTGGDLFNILALVFKSNEPVFEPRQGVSITKPDPDEEFVANELNSLPDFEVEEKPVAIKGNTSGIFTEQTTGEGIYFPKNPPPNSDMPSWKPSPDGMSFAKVMEGSPMDTFEVVTPEQMAATIEEKPEPVKRTTELLGSKSTGFTIEERLEDVDPDRRVKVWVNCVSCDFEGTKGTRLGNNFYKCPSCQERLHLTDATDVHGERDDEGYILLAQDKYYTKEERYYHNLEKESNQ